MLSLAGSRQGVTRESPAQGPLLTLSSALWGHGDSAVWDLILVDELNAHRNLTDLSLAEPGRPLHTCCISLAGLELGRLLRGSMWPAFGPRWTQGPNASPHQLRPSAKISKGQRNTRAALAFVFQTRWDFAPAAAAARAAGSQGLGLGS